MSIAQNGNKYNIVPETTTFLNKLPLGVYTLRYAKFAGFYLEKVKDFKLPEKVYGSFKEPKYWETYFSQTKRNVGILLSGYKGTGKTIEAQKFCIDSNRPTIIIEDNFEEIFSEMVSFLCNDEIQGATIFIDEYEKLYGESNSFLGLLDGAYQTHLAFVLTVNVPKISEYLKNRLGRIRYNKTYESLSEEVINEVLEDSLINKEYATGVKLLFNVMGVCTFDLLTHVISEVNLFDEDPFTCAKRLNLQKEAAWEIYYDIDYYVNSRKLDEFRTLRTDDVSLANFLKLESVKDSGTLIDEPTGFSYDIVLSEEFSKIIYTIQTAQNPPDQKKTIKPYKDIINGYTEDIRKYFSKKYNISEESAEEFFANGRVEFPYTMTTPPVFEENVTFGKDGLPILRFISKDDDELVLKFKFYQKTKSEVSSW